MVLNMVQYVVLPRVSKLFAKTSSLAADEKLAFNRLSRGFNEHASELK